MGGNGDVDSPAKLCAAIWPWKFCLSRGLSAVTTTQVLTKHEVTAAAMTASCDAWQNTPRQGKIQVRLGVVPGLYQEREQEVVEHSMETDKQRRQQPCRVLLVLRRAIAVPRGRICVKPCAPGDAALSTSAK